MDFSEIAPSFWGESVLALELKSIFRELLENSLEPIVEAAGSPSGLLDL